MQLAVSPEAYFPLQTLRWTGFKHVRSQFLLDPLPSHRPGDGRVIMDVLTDCQVRGQEASVHKIYHDFLDEKLALALSAHLGKLLLLKVPR